MIIPPQPAYPRYTRRDFPGYRFVPGENAHPTEDPQGHSYGRAEETVSPLTIQNWQEHPTYLFGVDLYNYAFWWESHEAWEAIWKNTSRRELTGQFLQGLIKISAALLKWHLHEQRGLEELYAGGLAHLHHVCREQEVYMGVDLMEHIAKLSAHFRAVIADVHKWPDPTENYPFIVLKK